MFNSNLYGKPFVRCPFCFRPLPFSRKECFHVCTECNKRVTDPDLLKRQPVKCECSRNVEICCPNCSDEKTGLWNKIPRFILDNNIPYFPFSIAGLPGSGKTNYITVLLEELSKTKDLYIALSDLNTEAQERQKKNSDLIFGKHEFPPPTPPNEKPVPQIWKISTSQDELWNKPLNYAFTIYDGAGEHSMGTTDQIIRNYIQYSEAVIITIDPVFIEHARGMIDSEKVANSERDYFSGKIIPAVFSLTEIIKFLRESKVKTNKYNKLDIPAAIVLTKFDTMLNNPNFAPKLSESIKVYDNAIMNKKVNIDQIAKRSDQIEYLLGELGEQNFVNLAKANFQSYMFFGVSSYGETPRDKEVVNVTRPYRVLDPILWLFHQKGFLD